MGRTAHPETKNAKTNPPPKGVAAKHVLWGKTKTPTPIHQSLAQELLAAPLSLAATIITSVQFMVNRTSFIGDFSAWHLRNLGSLEPTYLAPKQQTSTKHAPFSPCTCCKGKALVDENPGQISCDMHP